MSYEYKYKKCKKYQKPSPARTGVLLVDVQERMMRVIARADEVEKNCALLLRAAATLGLSVAATTQNRERIGPTRPEIRKLLAGMEEFDKMEFSCLANPAFRDFFLARREETADVVLCGVETHICIYQTARDLLAAGFRVFVPADAVSSRRRLNHRVGLARMRELGALVVSTEMILYELLERAGTEEFRALLPFLK